MEKNRVLGVAGPGGLGSGYGVGGDLVLTSAHVAGRAGEQAYVYRPGFAGVRGGPVVWCGTPGGRDDAALVLLGEGPPWPSPRMVRWGRMVTDRPGAACQTWGIPDVAQRHGQPTEAAQVAGRINPGSGFVGNQYVMDLRQHRPQWPQEGTSPWGGLSGAAVFCDRLLTGVVASDRAHSGGGQLNVVPAYVLHHDPTFRAALAEHGGPAVGLEAVELQHLAEAPADRGRTGEASPAMLLQAGWQTVPFHGRDDLLTNLRTWCGQEDGSGAWLLHGPGGQGKTRLAHHLAGLLAADHWTVLWPRSDTDASELRELRHVAKPLLIILDYAETRTGQLTALIEAATDHPGGTPFKVLLLARTDGDWWTQAKHVTRLAEDYLNEAPSTLLEPLEQAPASRAQAYRSAARALASALPHMRDWPAAANALPIPRLDHYAFANALTLQMTALADLLDTAIADGDAAPAPAPAAERAHAVEDRLLGHERRYWQNNAAACGLTPALSSATLETALAAAHLMGAANRKQADLTWSRLPALADQPRDRRDQVTAWIAALYPPTSPGRPWGAFQPDRIAERHIGRVLNTDPAIAEHLMCGADDAQTAQFLAVYSRAAAHPVFGGCLDTHLTHLCTHLPTELAPHLIIAAIQADRPQPLITALNAHATDPTAALGNLITLHDQFPLSSQRLSLTAAHLSQAITSRYRELAEANPDAHLADLASALNTLSNRLGDVGRRQEGLKAIEEAVRLYRELVKTNPDAHLPDLASALNNLSNRLGDVGRRQEGLKAIEEAVRLYRELAEANPDAHLADLASALNTLSIRLGDVGRRQEGLKAIEEAVRLYRELAEANPDAHLADLASALNNLAIDLGDAGRREKGQDAIGQAARTHLTNLDSALKAVTNRLEDVKQRKKDLEGAIDRAVRIHVAKPLNAFHDIAKPLKAVTNRLEDFKRRKKDLEGAIDRATRIRAANITSALNALSSQLEAVGRRQDGLDVIEEAVCHYRELVKTNPDAHLPDLASALNTLSIRLGDVGRRQEGLEAIEEAVRLYRELVKT
ncbi:tetratricopeptide repeat protein, partial [Streptomyces sp. NPDC014734]|uniref:tetratricopeptide repeat protein n=1 Tax=Streptomyces sp. NPDC014734 TaxID=3364886 RepID=UPI003702EA48